MKIISIVGNRPQFIKVASILMQLKKEHNNILVHTGQHYDKEMSKIFFEELSIPEPRYNLDIRSKTQGSQTGKILIKTERVLMQEKPNLVLVYGDTNSTLAGSLAASKLHIPIGHIESGLRSFDKMMPEEINRIIVDHISNILFCPTQIAVNNLKKEGINKGVYLSGDVMHDVIACNIEIADKKSKILAKLRLKTKSYLLATIHRANNTNIKKNLENIVEAFSKINERIVFPLHPRTKKFLIQHGLYDKLKNTDNVLLIKPVGYLDFISLEKNAKKILTDSGGIQKEAYFLKVPCITLRRNTEWTETVKNGWNTIVGANKKKIIEMAENFRPPNKQRDIFGNKKASMKIKKILTSLCL
jgi:UDP-N-acetylglucosamine 2-epimerase (non-hydrolysing)